MPEQKKILVAEDEKPLAKALNLKLAKMGFLVKNVFNGNEALQALAQEHFDFLLLDLMMPGVDGFAVLDNMQKQNIAVPTAVLSNLGQDEDVKRAKALGAKTYFVKADTPILNIVNYVKDQLPL